MRDACLRACIVWGTVTNQNTSGCWQLFCGTSFPQFIPASARWPEPFSWLLAEVLGTASWRLDFASWPASGLSKEFHFSSDEHMQIESIEWCCSRCSVPFKAFQDFLFSALKILSSGHLWSIKLCVFRSVTMWSPTIYILYIHKQRLQQG